VRTRRRQHGKSNNTCENKRISSVHGCSFPHFFTT
jgi:hypothetical protein